MKVRDLYIDMKWYHIYDKGLSELRKKTNRGDVALRFTEQERSETK